MIIGGFQKMTVQDFPGKVACIIFTHGCNFRCPFCHNASLVTQACEEVKQEEIFAYLNKRKGILDGVCISGGEPFVQGDKLFDFMKKIKEMGFLIKLDTNGYFPDRLKYAIDNGLVDYVAMDIKNCPDKYAMTAGVRKLDIAKIEESVKILMTSGVDYEFRTTVTAELHTPEDFTKIGEWIKGAKRYYIQNFEYSGNTIQVGSTSLDSQKLDYLLYAVLPYVPNAKVRS